MWGGGSRPEAPKAPLQSIDENRRDLRDLRRDGETALAPDDAIGGNVPMSSALWFEGAWCVHALGDFRRKAQRGSVLLQGSEDNLCRALVCICARFQPHHVIELFL